MVEEIQFVLRSFDVSSLEGQRQENAGVLDHCGLLWSTECASEAAPLGLRRGCADSQRFGASICRYFMDGGIFMGTLTGRTGRQRGLVFKVAVESGSGEILLAAFEIAIITALISNEVASGHEAFYLPGRRAQSFSLDWDERGGCFKF